MKWPKAKQWRKFYAADAAGQTDWSLAQSFTCFIQINAILDDTMKRFLIAGCLTMLIGCTSKRADHTNALKDSVASNATSAVNPALVDSITDTLTWTQPEFVLNNMKCFWTGKFVALRGDTMSHPAQFDLLAADNRKVLYTRVEDTDRKGFGFLRGYDGLFRDLFKDINFDGYSDILEYNKFSSGSGGSFYDVYVFDSGKREFVLSKELSGADITVDTLKRTTSDYWKSGYGNYFTRVLHYNAKGKLLFTEGITSDLIRTDTSDLQVTVTKKIVNGKLVRTSTDTSVFEGY